MEFKRKERKLYTQEFQSGPVGCILLSMHWSPSASKAINQWETKGCVFISMYSPRLEASNIRCQLLIKKRIWTQFWFSWWVMAAYKLMVREVHWKQHHHLPHTCYAPLLFSLLICKYHYNSSQRRQCRHSQLVPSTRNLKIYKV